jgi:hypothetical protein
MFFPDLIENGKTSDNTESSPGQDQVSIQNVPGQAGDAQIDGFPDNAVVLNTSTTTLASETSTNNTPFAQNQPCCGPPLLGTAVSVAVGNKTTVTTLYQSEKTKRDLNERLSALEITLAPSGKVLIDGMLVERPDGGSFVRLQHVAPHPPGERKPGLTEHTSPLEVKLLPSEKVLVSGKLIERSDGNSFVQLREVAKEPKVSHSAHGSTSSHEGVHTLPLVGKVRPVSQANQTGAVKNQNNISAAAVQHAGVADNRVKQGANAATVGFAWKDLVKAALNKYRPTKPAGLIIVPPHLSKPEANDSRPIGSSGVVHGEADGQLYDSIYEPAHSNPKPHQDIYITATGSFTATGTLGSDYKSAPIPHWRPNSKFHPRPGHGGVEVNGVDDGHVNMVYPPTHTQTAAPLLHHIHPKPGKLGAVFVPGADGITTIVHAPGSHHTHRPGHLHHVYLNHGHHGVKVHGADGHTTIVHNPATQATHIPHYLQPKPGYLGTDGHFTATEIPSASYHTHKPDFPLSWRPKPKQSMSGILGPDGLFTATAQSTHAPGHRKPGYHDIFVVPHKGGHHIGHHKTPPVSKPVKLKPGQNTHELEHSIPSIPQVPSSQLPKPHVPKPKPSPLVTPGNHTIPSIPYVPRPQLPKPHMPKPKPLMTLGTHTIPYLETTNPAGVDIVNVIPSIPDLPNAVPLSKPDHTIPSVPLIPKPRPQAYSQHADHTIPSMPYIPNTDPTVDTYQPKPVDFDNTGLPKLNTNPKPIDFDITALPTFRPRPKPQFESFFPAADMPKPDRPKVSFKPKPQFESFFPTPNRPNLDHPKISFKPMPKPTQEGFFPAPHWLKPIHPKPKAGVSNLPQSPNLYRPNLKPSKKPHSTYWDTLGGHKPGNYHPLLNKPHSGHYYAHHGHHSGSHSKLTGPWDYPDGSNRPEANADISDEVVGVDSEDHDWVGSNTSDANAAKAKAIVVQINRLKDDLRKLLKQNAISANVIGYLQICFDEEFSVSDTQNWKRGCNSALASAGLQEQV